MADRIDMDSSQSSQRRCSDLVDRVIDAGRPGRITENDQVRTSGPLGTFKFNIFPAT